MTRCWTMIAALAALLPAPALAEGWRHASSGIAVAELPDGLHVGQVTDNRRDGSDVYVQFGDGREPVTFYVYRSAFPSPALWFARTRMAMDSHVGSGGASAEPRRFTLGGGAAPNGLREEIELPGGNGYRATAVAMAQYGEWMIKVRITSASLDRAGIAARMDALLAAIGLPGAAPAPLPLNVPTPCPDANRMSGRPRLSSPEAALLAAAALMTADDEARGRAGLATDPAGWCRENSAIPARYVTVYRRRDGRAWTALVGDSGMAVSAYPVEIPDSRGAATFAANSSMTGLARLYDDLPAPDSAIEAALGVAAGQERPTVSIDANRPR